MQIGKILFTVAVVLGTLGTSFGQNLNNIQRGQRGYIPPPLPREQGAIAIDNTLEDIDEKMDLYAAEFELDAFEKAVHSFPPRPVFVHRRLCQSKNITTNSESRRFIRVFNLRWPGRSIWFRRREWNWTSSSRPLTIKGAAKACQSHDDTNPEKPRHSLRYHC